MLILIRFLTAERVFIEEGNKHFSSICNRAYTPHRLRFTPGTS
ncbi:hypothetical protein GGQ03_003332 [Salinibacter ruber]|nr:hypothetical protein [Salinibacter ruber]